MENEEQSFFASHHRGAKTVTGAARDRPRRQQVGEIPGRLRPYRDVRAGFEPWRRVALLAWASREEASTAH